jgi:hypothetical protein
MDQIPATEFIKAFDNILVDHSGRINVFSGWEKGEVDLVRPGRYFLCLISR